MTEWKHWKFETKNTIRNLSCTRFISKTMTHKPIEDGVDFQRSSREKGRYTNMHLLKLSFGSKCKMWVVHNRRI